MSITIDDFFRPLELKDYPLDEDYAKIQPFIKAATAFSQITHHSIYIIDYYKKGFAYVSEDPLFLCGMSPGFVLNEGYRFYLNHVPEEDLKLLLEINEAGFRFYQKIAIGDRLNYKISYDFHLVQKDKSLLLVNHKLTPLILDKDSNIWLALCVVSPASNDLRGNITIRKKGENEFYEYNVTDKVWITKTVVRLSKREREILLLSGQGLTMDKIAGNLCLSIDTIKFHKRSIFRKLGTRNISEAILMASNYNII